VRDGQHISMKPNSHLQPKPSFF